MNKDLETIIKRNAAAIECSNASFEKTVRQQTRWIATIVFSAIGLMIASSASHCISSESGPQKKNASKAGMENKRHRKHGPPAAKGGSVQPLR
jgi:hypothetical protein